MKRVFAWFLALIAIFGFPLIVTVMAFLAPTKYEIIVTALVAGWLWRRSVDEIDTIREYFDSWAIA